MNSGISGGWRAGCARVAGRTSRAPRVDARTRAACEALDGRVLLSKARVVDAGDFYWYQDAKQPLLRATDAVVVGFEPSSAKRMRRLVDGLTARGGALDGYQELQKLEPYGFLLKRVARGLSPEYQTITKGMKRFPALNYVAPTFFIPGSPGRSSVTDEITVDLNDNVDPGVFFDGRFRGYRPAAGGVNAFIGTLSHQGGLDLLTVIDQLHGHASIEYAEPTFYSEIVNFA